MKFLYNPQKIGLAVVRGEGVIKAKDLDALWSATEIVTSAEEKAAEIIAAARAEFDHEKERGYLEGKELAQREALTCLLAEHVYIDKKLQGMEQRLAFLVKSSVRKILSEFDETDLAVSVTKSALRQMREEQVIQIRLAPSMMESIAPIAQAFEEKYSGERSVELIEDASIPPPNLVFETGTGRIECDILTELSEVEDAIDRNIYSLYEDEVPGGALLQEEEQ
ncbi:Flagellar biosynthesis/type III secretory pathway protein [Stappia aggregata IAM 12614]|uniref:Type 3 secretion system stator protein n=1 Tax=Roseibium aggregatum (strain ATCC 25650 / DSM 13394 / JCM 20685 / NBRC 16684 / NCIMB 2208 / IAM 12614 / B1) TaxID=384765 RepID=A0P0K9_ROSAI|nr:type III secretion system stator protein SctL [Roseibium aggregatum]EAV41323.1 Flagellar biosynthesis/type III secretory pathway protein [Stappia aggregata IAM 12614] [Roseibium aggregatum IAM 12614]